jgi:peptidoglycan/xylan/chitin deacetylase (PgdA/CDA1 family)
MKKVRMPRRPVEWPNDARVAILPCVVLETWPEEELGKPGSAQASFRHDTPSGSLFTTDIALITDRLYGERCGAYRVLDVLEEAGVHTTWFMNGAGVEAHPEVAKEILAAGHELASENWRHEYVGRQTDDVQKAEQLRTVASFEKNAGVRPVGYISSGERPNHYTLPLIAELGYRYYMGTINEDLPYTMRTEKGDLVAMSYGIWLTDHQMASPTRKDPRAIFQWWKDQFDQLYEEAEAGRPGMMTMGIHPFIIGRPFRAKVLREFLAYTSSKPKVWFPKCVEMADHYLKNYRDAYVETWPSFYGTGKPRPKEAVRA